MTPLHSVVHDSEWEESWGVSPEVHDHLHSFKRGGIYHKYFKMFHIFLLQLNIGHIANRVYRSLYKTTDM